MQQSTISEFLEAVADAKDLTDVNIAAGIAHQELAAPRGSSLKRAVVLGIATIAAATVFGDAFAASPVHAGILPMAPMHVFTHFGARDWSGYGPSVFGHPLPDVI